ncbi:hypothetical protein IPP75_04510 [Candidatus Saccharibacteria bacterium]|nr:MAG: hypothetical protein IPP75_04510 [Candidatus Saccharibacteria bacterium]
MHEHAPTLDREAPEEVLSAVEAELLGDLSLRLALLEHEAAAKADELARRVGNVAINCEREAKESTLHEAIQERNTELIAANARSDVIERTFKAGHVMEVRQTINERGDIEQHGQSSEQTQANTLKYANANPILKPRTQAETRNAYYIDALRREGLLEENYAVVVSLCPNADDSTLDELGFFAFSKSLVIQATTTKEGGVTTESAFVAGVKQDGESRYDHEVAVAFGKEFGEDWRGLDDAGIISRVLLVPKEYMPDGVIDLVKLWDDLAGGTFFGMERPRQDYVQYLEQCKERERQFEPTVQKIVNELLLLAPVIRSPLEAVKRLHEVSERHTLERALVDYTIDSRVFGTKAALDLEEARFHYARGNMHQVQMAMTKARTNAASGSCPSGVSGLRGKGSLYNEDGSLKTPEQIAKEEAESIKDEDEYGSLNFVCKHGHPNTRPRHKLIPTCKHCGVSVGCGPKVDAKKKPNKHIPKSTGSLIAPVFWEVSSLVNKVSNKSPNTSQPKKRQDYVLAS